MSRSALVNDGVPAFLVLLVLLLAISLVAVIRWPRSRGAPSRPHLDDLVGVPDCRPGGQDTRTEV